MYSPLLASVNVRTRVSGTVLAFCVLASPALPQTAKDSRPLFYKPLFCSDALTRLFTPAHPQLGRYEVCTTPRPITEVAERGWTIDAVQARDAFGPVGEADKSALARLYGGQRAKVALGWIQSGEGFESVTLISPYPDVSLRHLEPGTLVIRYVVRP